jgi:Na+-transporting methylmalonyl-CoA/oxaloacetate decarboxylase gamma subunit
MGLVIRLIELLLMLLPVAGVVFAGMKAVSAVRRRFGDEAADEPAREQVRAPEGNRSARWPAIQRIIHEHDRTDTRWLDYELDVVKLLDFPVMCDMREPVTERFHRAKLRADLLRPVKAEVLLDDRETAQEYRQAVEEYVTAFDVAESEAIRRRRNHFTDGDQQRFGRAQRLLRVALDGAATPQERDRAYQMAKRELDGLIALPERARAQIERGITGELGS